MSGSFEYPADKAIHYAMWCAFMQAEGGPSDVFIRFRKDGMAMYEFIQMPIRILEAEQVDTSRGDLHASWVDMKVVDPFGVRWVNVELTPPLPEDPNAVIVA